MAGERGILARRRIEAEIIKPIYAILRRDYGEDRAKEIVAEAITEAAREAGRRAAAELAPAAADLASFVELLPLWLKGGALEIEIRRREAGRFEYDVKRCRYAEMYRDLGLGDDLGVLLSCNRDAAFIEGYAPEVEFRRTGTIMEGARICDFRYRAPGGKPKDPEG
ncbi:MAG: L-2-amino-thiazoline-4-carboxylic acid hydrolase [Planctomycetota bacterium]|jgi:predicted ArsR family transcriptional regulator|nr:L-2-amino-thiazoline-4-carboxylic acid hydrolase [Planctomycetota bacterium]